MRLTYLVSHPIQYQAPLLRMIAGQPDIELRVLFERAAETGTAFDPGFGREVAWDVPLTEGYENEVAATLGDVETALRSSDVLWLHGWDSGLKRGALAAAGRFGVPALMRGENTLAAMPDGWGPRGVVKRLYLQRIFARCAGFLCIGSDNRRYYESHGIGSDRLFSMPYAVDNAFFRDCAEAAAGRRQDFRAELGLEPGPKVGLFAGKLQRRKHPRTLLDAWARLEGGGGKPPYLLFVGDGEERAALQAAAGPYGERIRVLGFRNQTELPAFYDVADVFVLAAEREPWGLAVNEAMNGATAVIASDQCGCTADLIDDSCGRVVAAADAAALAAALADILAEPGRTEAMGQAARRRVAEWGFEQDLKGLRAAVEAVIPGTSSPRPA